MVYGVSYCPLSKNEELKAMGFAGKYKALVVHEPGGLCETNLGIMAPKNWTLLSGVTERSSWALQYFQGASMRWAKDAPLLVGKVL